MSRLILAAAALFAAAPAASIAHDIRSASPFPLLDWSVDSTNRADGKVQLSMRTRWDGNSGSSNWSSGYSLAELQGLSAAQLASPVGTPVRFALVREAGRFDCSGVAANHVGNGNCRFTAQPEFASMLAARGIGRPSPRQSYHLAMSGAGRASLDALAANGYPRPTMDEFVRLAIHRVTPNYVQSLAQTGYRLQSIDDLVRFKIHRVDADYIRELAALGPQFRNIPAKDLVRLRIHRVSPELVRAYARYGYGQLDRDNLLSMSIHRVTPEFIEKLSRHGYRGLSARQLVKMRIFGVTPEYIRSLQQSGISLPSAEQLVKLRMSGFTPDKGR